MLEAVEKILTPGATTSGFWFGKSLSSPVALSNDEPKALLPHTFPDLDIAPTEITPGRPVSYTHLTLPTKRIV